MAQAQEPIQPYQIALDLLVNLGIRFTGIYNTRGGIKRDQLRVINMINPGLPVKQNAYNVIKRLESSPNPNIKWASNFKNILVSTVQYSLMQQLKQLPAKDRRATKIKWLPSTAKEEDPIHALYYGKTMSLEKAMRLGLSVRYGCQCRFRIISGSDKVMKVIADFQKGFRK